MKKILLSHWSTVLLLVVISIFSLFTILSIAPDLFRLQLIYIILGFLIYFLISKIHPSYFKAFSREFYIISAILLFLIFIVGIVVKGSVRWIDLGFFQFQPSEIVKPFLIIFFADRLARQNFSLKNFVIDVLLFFLLAGLVFKQPDLGNFIVYSSIFCLMLIFSRVQLTHLIVFFLIIFLSLPILFLFLKPYQKARIFAFASPENDPQGISYHQIQAVITSGSGGFFGRGIGKGTQTHLLFLPEKQTDFIFASFSEEFGFVGDFVILLCYFLLFFKIISLIGKTKRDFDRLFLVGVFSYLFSQSMIHMGMNIGILPVTGVTLPLFSAGGSSITSVLFTLGMVAFYEKNLI